MTKATGAVNLGTKEADGMMFAVVNGKVATPTNSNADGIVHIQEKQKKGKTLKINKLFFHSTSWCQKTKTNKNLFLFLTFISLVSATSELSPALFV